MGIVRREGEWRLEKREEGLYEVTYRREPEAKVITRTYSPGMIDDTAMSLITVHEVRSYAEAEGTFEEYAHGGPPAGMASFDTGNSSLSGSDVGGDVDFGLGGGEARCERNGDLLEDAQDLPPGGIALIVLLAGGVLLHNTGFAPGELMFLTGAALAGLGIVIFAWAGLLLRWNGWKEAVEFLLTVEEVSSTNPASSDSSSEPKTTPPAPEKLKNELIFGRADQSCEWCGDQPLDNPEVHHIEPRSDGGPNEPENLIVLCPTCHTKADRGGISQTKLKGKMGHLLSEQH